MTARSFKEGKKNEREKGADWLGVCLKGGGGGEGLHGDHLAARLIRREQREEKSIEWFQPSGRA